MRTQEKTAKKAEKMHLFGRHVEIAAKNKACERVDPVPSTA
jgi:hypothetical protein